jgi:adenine-specific DNA glycosylase
VHTYTHAYTDTCIHMHIDGRMARVCAPACALLKTEAHVGGGVGAVASIVFGHAAPVVDGNVVRVLSRLRALAADPRAAATTARYWSAAQDLAAQNGSMPCTLRDTRADTCLPMSGCAQTPKRGGGCV